MRIIISIYESRVFLTGTIFKNCRIRIFSEIPLYMFLLTDQPKNVQFEVWESSETFYSSLAEKCRYTTSLKMLQVEFHKVSKIIQKREYNPSYLFSINWSHTCNYNCIPAARRAHVISSIGFINITNFHTIERYFCWNNFLPQYVLYIILIKQFYLLIFSVNSETYFILYARFRFHSVPE